jgi:hypothetical protein
MQRRTGLLLIAIAVLATLPQPAAGQRDRSSDNERKGLFVHNLILFVRWPADAFQNPTEAIRVQVIGRDPFDGSLDRLLADQSMDRRRVVVTHSVAATTAPFPHLLFVSASEEPRLERVLAAYCHAPVLTVSDIDHFANRGGVIGLVEEDRALRFAINQTAASEARLQVSAQLFHLAVPLLSAISPCGAR